MFKPVRSGLSLLALCALLMGSMLGGCVLGGDDPKDEGPARTFSKGVYTDSEFGYRLTFPAGWYVTAYDPPFYGLIDFSGYQTTGKGANPSAYATHDSLYDDETLSEMVHYRHDPEYGFRDSSVILPAEVRGGVEVIPVNAWNYDDFGTVRTRVLYFVRRHNMIIVKLTHYAASFDTSADLHSVDASLTFFGAP